MHVITVNDYLARRDAACGWDKYTPRWTLGRVINHDSSYRYDAGHVGWIRSATENFKVFEFLRPCTRKRIGDVTYGTNSGTVLITCDNIAYSERELRQRDYFAVSTKSILSYR